MLRRKNVGGWVLTLVALSLFGGLLLRRLADEAPTSSSEPMAASVIATDNQRDAARDLSAAFEAVTAQYLPVMVAIYRDPQAVISMPDRDMTFDREILKLPISQTKPTGSCGIVVSSDGYILTSLHLLGSHLTPGDSVGVIFHKGRRFLGELTGYDHVTNLALIKIAAKGLPHAKFGDSDRLRVGQWVMAIGQAGNASRSIAAGLVNAKGQSRVGLPQKDDLIQIEALRENGNGGAVVNLDGELVGLSTASAGFALPANLARRVFQNLREHGKVTRGFVGVTSQDIDPYLAKALQLNSTLGALLVDIGKNTPAESAGLRRGDVVLQFAGVPMANAKDFENTVAAQTPGKSVQATVWRDTAKIDCEIIPAERPAVNGEALEASSPHPLSNKLGIQIKNLAPEIMRAQNMPGVVVTQLDFHSPAARVLAAGDVIQEINRQRITNVREFQTALQPLNAGETALLLARRGGQNFFCGVEVK